MVLSRVFNDNKSVIIVFLTRRVELLWDVGGNIDDGDLIDLTRLVLFFNIEDCEVVVLDMSWLLFIQGDMDGRWLAGSRDSVRAGRHEWHGHDENKPVLFEAITLSAKESDLHLVCDSFAVGSTIYVQSLVT